MSSKTFKDQTFFFIGTFSKHTKHEAQSVVKRNGGKVLTRLSSDLNYLVVGSDPDDKLQKAIGMGTVSILSEDEFLAMQSGEAGAGAIEKGAGEEDEDLLFAEIEAMLNEPDEDRSEAVDEPGVDDDSNEEGVSGFLRFVDSVEQPGALLLLTSFTLIDIIMRDNALTEDELYSQFTRFIGWVHGQSYGWDNIDDNGYLPNELLREYQRQSKDVAHCYAEAAASGTLSYRTFLKSIGAAGIGATLSPEERGDLTTYLLMFEHVVSRLFTDSYASVSRDIGGTIEQIDCADVVDDLTEVAEQGGDAFVRSYS